MLRSTSGVGLHRLCHSRLLEIHRLGQEFGCPARAIAVGTAARHPVGHRKSGTNPVMFGSVTTWHHGWATGVLAMFPPSLVDHAMPSGGLLNAIGEPEPAPFRS